MRAIRTAEDDERGCRVSVLNIKKKRPEGALDRKLQ
jgi:hypothetical protein